MIVRLLTEHHLEFLSLKGGCRDSSESTLVKMSNCWKSHAAAHLKPKLSIILHSKIVIQNRGVFKLSCFSSFKNRCRSQTMGTKLLCNDKPFYVCSFAIIFKV